MIKSSVVPAN